MEKRDDKIISKLRNNSRASLSEIGKELGIPTSTVFDRVKRLQNRGLVIRYTALIDYLKAGYNHLAHLTIKVGKEDKEKLRKFLMKNKNINNLYEANDGYEYVMDTIHKNMKEFITFKNELLNFDIKEIKQNVIIEDLKRESFSFDKE